MIMAAVSKNPLMLADVMAYVRTALGHPAAVVELGDDHITQAVNDALGVFNSWLCEIQMRVTYDRSGSTMIQLEDNVRGVAFVKFVYPESQRQISRINVFEMMYRMVVPGFPISDWYLYRSFFDMFEGVRGTEPDFKFDFPSKQLLIDTWSGPWDICYGVCQDMTVESFGYSKTSYRQRFLDLCVARSKKILAPIRGKFGDSIPAPGGTIQTDAAVLRTEAKETEDEVKKWLQSVGKFSTVMRIG